MSQKTKKFKLRYEFNINNLDYIERKDLVGLLAKAGITVKLIFRENNTTDDDCFLVIYLQLI